MINHISRRLRRGLGVSLISVVIAALALGTTSVPSKAAGAAAPTTRRADWYAIARCESGLHWHINTGNGYWGGLQFAHATWFANGGGRFNGKGWFPFSPAQQIAVGKRVLARQGPRAWPTCFRWA